MNENPTRVAIIEAAVPLIALRGYAGASMRNVAEAVPVKSSVLYHYFSSKAELMRAVRKHVTVALDTAIHALPPAKNTAELLRQRLRFQIDEQESIVCLLQYFMSVKEDFPRQQSGYVPQRAYGHMREIIDRGLAEGCYQSADPDFDAKILTHMVNGFLLEYYPHNMTSSEKTILTEKLATFIEQSLRKTV